MAYVNGVLVCCTVYIFLPTHTCTYTYTCIYTAYTCTYACAGYDEVMPLWAMSTSSKGGLDLSSTTIGEIMSITGIVLLLFTFLIYPTLANYLGPHMSFLVGQASCAPLLLGLILIRSLPSYIPQIPMNIVNIMLVVDYVLFKITTNLCFSSICLVINQSVATNQRASVNGITPIYYIVHYLLHIFTLY